MKIAATTRNTQGTGASRRLRNAGTTPGIVYGGNTAAANIELDHNALYHAMRKEAFHSSVLELELDGKVQQVLLRAYQMHPFKRQVLHIDFQRVDANTEIHAKVPLHFSGADVSPAVKLGGSLISHVATTLDVACLPSKLPAFIAVDLSQMQSGKSLHISELKLPEGVRAIVGKKSDPVVASASGAKKEEDAKS